MTEMLESVSQVDRRYLELRGRVLDLAGLHSIPKPEPLIDQMLFKDSLAWIQGKAGHGKSFCAVGMACCVGTGTDWHGFKVTQGKVLYLIAEGASGLATRVDAWQMAEGVQVENVLFLPLPVQLMDGVDAAAFTQLLTDLVPTFVIVDTQARTTVGADENSSRDMGMFVDTLEHLRRACGATIAVVHHEGRSGENLRGSSALEGAATSILRVCKDGDVIEVKTVKQKDAPEHESLTLNLQPIGESAYLSQGGLGNAHFLTASGTEILTVLRGSFGNKGALKTELREAVGQSKSTWYRSINDLINKGKVLVRESGRSTYYTLPADDIQETFP